MLNNFNQYNFILGSNSPRRSEILKDMGIDFKIRASNIDETIPKGIKNKNVPIFLAKEKANFLAKELNENEILITADTIVLMNDKIITKPLNKNEAKNILQKISNNMHEVITGVCITSKSNQHAFSSKTEVFFNKINDYEIEYYLEKFKPYDKAGSYGIQEWLGIISVRKIIGSYTNVVGLPSSELYQELNKFI
ncbi:Maf family nucleotide pyrophosphatase [Flavobacteriales bacterium]|nr:Maf family nucleotide pyrophosphatase [Flavobacteriales bacterium]